MFDKYQQQACQTFKEHTELPAEQSRLLNWVLGLAGEAGEVSEIVKHHVWGQEPLDKMKLAKELGDVLWYLAAICTTTNMDLSAVAELNINKLAHRYNQQEYDVSGSILRHEKETEFEQTPIYKNLEAKILKQPAPLNIIFVGPDGAGKTTLAVQIAKILANEGYVYHKCNYKQEDKPNLSLELLKQKTKVIYDRFYYPDDIIYSRVIYERDHENPLDWDTQYWRTYNQVLDQLCELNTLYFLVTASQDVLEQRSDSWKDDYIKKEELPKIMQLYERCYRSMRQKPIYAVVVDTTNTSIEENVNFCLKHIRKAQAAFSNMDE